MATATGKSTTAAEWRKLFMEELNAGKHLNFSSMQAFFKDFGERHREQVSWNSASTYYYWEKKNGGLTNVAEHQAGRISVVIEEERKEVLTKESTPVAVVSETLERSDLSRLQRLMTEKPSYLSDPDYMVGQTVKVMVTRVEVYGALVETVDGHKTPGLIHKSNTAYAFVSDPGHYFAFTDELEAEIMKIESDGKLSLSTKGFGIKPKYQYNKPVVPNPKPMTPAPAMNTMAAKLEPVKDKIIAEEKVPVAATATMASDELKEVYTYLNGIVGVVTPAAQAQFTALIEKHGMFRFTKALTKAETGFQKDLGLALAKHVEASMSQSL